MKIIRTKEFSDIIKKIERKNELDIKSKIKLKIMENSKKMKYISNFEIVNMETILYLKISLVIFQIILQLKQKVKIVYITQLYQIVMKI